LRFARYFGTSAEFWMNLQARYELDSAARKKKSDIEGTIQPLAAAH
jgi:plasmid maintenance system antidote protein VapI